MHLPRGESGPISWWTPILIPLFLIMWPFAENGLMKTLRSRMLPEVARWAWLWLPVAVLFAPYIAKNVWPWGYENIINGEQGLIENITFISAIVALACGLVALRHTRAYPQRWFRAWLVLMCLGCLYFGGEELSWGQQYFHWGTPKEWGETYNDQNETNLHNGSWLMDQLPRTLLSIGAVVGGVIVPLIWRRRGKWKPEEMRYWFWPTAAGWPAGLFANVIHLPEHIAKKLGPGLPPGLNIAEGESKECLLAIFLMIYLASIAIRARAQDGTD